MWKRQQRRFCTTILPLKITHIILTWSFSLFLSHHHFCGNQKHARPNPNFSSKRALHTRVCCPHVINWSFTRYIGVIFSLQTTVFCVILLRLWIRSLNSFSTTWVILLSWGEFSFSQFYYCSPWKSTIPSIFQDKKFRHERSRTSITTIMFSSKNAPALLPLSPIFESSWRRGERDSSKNSDPFFPTRLL